MSALPNAAPTLPRRAQRIGEVVMLQRLSQFFAPESASPTVTEYSTRWLSSIRARVRRSTYTSYEMHVRRDIVPALGSVRLDDLKRRHILAAGLSRNTVRLVHATLRSMLRFAAIEEIVAGDPSAGLARHLRLTAASGGKIKAFDAGQLAKFLRAARAKAVYYPLFCLMAGSGLRLGEAVALQKQDLDFDSARIRVERALHRGRLGDPKDDEARTVDVWQQDATGRLAPGLDDILHEVIDRDAARGERLGWQPSPAWLFRGRTGEPLQARRVERMFKEILADAGLSDHFTPHSLRHTHASLLLQQGESAVYVQRQLGHANYSITVDLYGRWLPIGRQAKT